MWCLHVCVCACIFHLYTYFILFLYSTTHCVDIHFRDVRTSLLVSSPRYYAHMIMYLYTCRFKYVHICIYIYTHLCLHITFVQLHINIHIACKSLDCIACPVTLDFIGFCRFISTYRQSTIVQYVPSGPQECARHWKVVGQLPVGVALPTSHWDDTTSKPYKR